jgi:hypothetical protein
MIRSLGFRIGFLLFVLLTFSGMAHAVGGTSFRLALQDFQTGSTGVQLIITDNMLTSKPAYNDKNGLVGDIGWFGNVGLFYVNINATSTDGVSGGGQLTLTANVAYQGTAPASGEQFVLTVEDQGYAATAGSTVLLQNTVNNLSLTNNANSISTNTWLTTAAGDVPAFGTNGIQGTNVKTVALSQPGIPADANGPSTQTFFVPLVDPSDTTGMDVTLPNAAATTNLFSQATVNFAAGSSGVANFTLTAADPLDTSGGGGGGNVPEPTTLMLLGSALLGLGVLRRKQI